MKLKNKVYDVLKWIALVFIPALTAFLGVLLPVCGVPDVVTQAVLTVLPASDTFLGALLGLSSIKYHRDEENEENR